jgi:hypothetical protein
MQMAHPTPVVTTLSGIPGRKPPTFFRWGGLGSTLENGHWLSSWTVAYEVPAGSIDLTLGDQEVIDLLLAAYPLN